MLTNKYKTNLLLTKIPIILWWLTVLMSVNNKKMLNEELFVMMKYIDIDSSRWVSDIAACVWWTWCCVVISDKAEGWTWYFYTISGESDTWSDSNPSSIFIIHSTLAYLLLFWYINEISYQPQRCSAHSNKSTTKLQNNCIVLSHFASISPLSITSLWTRKVCELHDIKLIEIDWGCSN